MRQVFTYIWLACSLFAFGKLQAQNTLIDSLEKRLENYPVVDHLKIDLMNDLAFEYIKSNPEKGIDLLSQVLWQADSLKYTKGLFRATIHKGSSFWISGLYDDALRYYLKASTMKVDDEKGYEFLYNNIAETYKKKNQVDSAITYLKKAWSIAENRSGEDIPPLLASNIAEVFFALEAYDSATYYYNLCLKFSERDQYDRGKSYALSGLGDIAYVKGQTARAWAYQNDAFKIRDRIKDQRGLIKSHLTFGQYYQDDSDYQKAIRQYNIADSIAIKNAFFDQVYTIYLKKYELYKAMDNFQMASLYLQKYHMLKDSLDQQNFLSRISTIKNSLNREIHEAENSLLRAQQLENQRSIRIQIIVILAISAVIIVLIFYIFRNYRKLHESRTDREKLEQLNKLILKKNDEIEAINKRLDSKLDNTKKMLAEGQQITKLGSWEYEFESGEMHWTDETYRQLGLEPGSVNPSVETFERYTSPESALEIKEMIRKVIKTKEQHETQAEIIAANGERRVVALKVFPEIHDNWITRLYGTNLDITELIAQEDQQKMIIQSLLNLSHNANLKNIRFDKFLEDVLITASETLEVSRVSFWQFDHNMELLICTALYDARDKSFSSGQTLLGSDFPEYFRTLTKQRTINIDDVMQHETTQEFKNYMVDKRICSQLDVQINNDGKLLGVLSFANCDVVRKWTYSDQRYAGSISDIISTAYSNYQNKKLEKEKTRLIEKLVRKNKNLSEFAYVISHNLREPVAQIMGLTQVYNSPETIEIREEIFDRIVKATGKLDQVIKDLSALLTEDEDDNFTIEKIKLDDIIKLIELNLNKEIKAASPVISKRFALDYQILSNKSFISNILYHLISNSIKFRDPSRELSIGIEAENIDGYHQITVIDNGTGIDLDRHQEKLFKMYQKFHGAESGKGLGLYIVKNQVELLSGKISVVSQPGRGTKFTIKLPIDQVKEESKTAELIK